MKFRALMTCLVLILGTAGLFSVATKGSWLMAAESDKTGPKLAHNVFFSLNDNSDESRQAMIDSCKKYLVNHPGVLFFACGSPVADLDRPVNDLNFDVGLHLVFADRAAHDKYQTASDHLKFIEENRANFKQVRVFDTYVDVVPPQ